MQHSSKKLKHNSRPVKKTTDRDQTKDIINPDPGKTLVFQNIIEFVIIASAVSYSFLCFDAYLLNTFSLGGSFLPVFGLFMPEFCLAVWLIGKKSHVQPDIPVIALCIAIFCIIFLFQWSVSPSFLPMSTSADYPHHYILIEYITSHGSLPPLNYGQIGEMAQYPFGPSFATACISLIFGISILNALALLSNIVLGCILVCSYLITLDLLKKSPSDKKIKSILALASPIMIVSLPIYFIGQLNHDFYYSMVWGELLVLVSLLILIKIESGDLSWLFLFMITSMGIIYTYTLYIVIPFATVFVWLLLNKREVFARITKIYIISGSIVVALFLLFTYQRFSVGMGILEHEGATVVFSLSNFNFLFIALVILGVFIAIHLSWIQYKSPFSILLLITIMEIFAFVILNYFGKIALYYADKNFYLLVLLLSPLTAIPLLHLVSKMQTDSLKKIVGISSVGLILIFSIFCVATFDLNKNPPVNNEDITFSHDVETYFSGNNITYNNLTISDFPLKAYWSALMLHISKDYADQQYLGKYTSPDAWLNNPNSRYLIGEVAENSSLSTIEINGIRIQPILHEGTHVLLEKSV
jgi:hypothetical protein